MLLLAALVVLPACDSTEDHSVGGTYVASTVEGSAQIDYTLVLSPIENGGTASFSLTYDIAFDGGPGEIEVVTGTATYDHPTLTLVAESEGETSPFSATVSDGGDSVTLAVERVTLTRR
ncbi:hypothetical protein [Rubrivirga sp.]|uniref:hypothetical protein n=1 Tax=Rubrivirga sp. TaxID=1885344 RepID=UPI003C75B0B4